MSMSPRERPLFAVSDLALMPGWLARRVLYWAPTPYVLRFARLRGYVLSYVANKRHRVMRRLREAFGETKTDTELRAITRRHIQYLEEQRLVKVWPQRGDFAAALHDIEGMEHLEAALGRGKGVLLLGMHFGYSRLSKQFLRSRGYACWNVGSMIEDDGPGLTKFGALVHDSLLRLPRFDSVSDNDLPVGLNVRPIVEALKRNEIVAIAVDGNHATQFTPHQILGERRPLATGAVKIATATGAVLLPGFVVDSEKVGAERLRLVIGDEVSLEMRDGVVDAQATHETYVQRFVPLVQRYPHLYSWLLFKRRKTLGTNERHETLVDRYIRKQSGAQRNAVSSSSTREQG